MNRDLREGKYRYLRRRIYKDYCKLHIPLIVNRLEI